MESTSIRILLAEDHTLMRAGMRKLLETLPGIEVVAEASDGQEALRQVAAEHPDLVLMDVTMTGMGGLDATARLTREFPGVRVVMLSMHAGEEMVRQALRAGASGYLLKDADTAELELAVRAVMRGEMYLSPAVSRHVVGGYTPRDTKAGSLERLTPRQREILQLIARGGSTKEIAHALGLSVKTVETHRAQLMDRLGIHDVAGLVRYAIRAGLVTAEE